MTGRFAGLFVALLVLAIGIALQGASALQVSARSSTPQPASPSIQTPVGTGFTIIKKFDPAGAADGTSFYYLVTCKDSGGGSRFSSVLGPISTHDGTLVVTGGGGASLVVGDTCTVKESDSFGGPVPEGWAVSPSGEAPVTPAADPATSTITFTNSRVGFTIVKKFDPSSAADGTSFYYLVTCKDSGGGSRFASVFGPISTHDGTLVVTGGGGAKLALGDTCTVMESDSFGGPIPDGWAVSPSGDAPVTPGANPANTTVTFTNGHVGFTIKKQFSPSSAADGTSFYYLVTCKDAGGASRFGSVFGPISAHDGTLVVTGGGGAFLALGDTCTVKESDAFGGPIPAGWVASPAGEAPVTPAINPANTTVTFTNSVAPPADLTVTTSSSNGSANVQVNTDWTWTLHVANGNTLTATFANGQTVLVDSLPSGITYGVPATANASGLTGTVACAIAGNKLTCIASGEVKLAQNGSLDVQFTARAAAAKTYTNPAGQCKVDPNNNVPESDETNNNCNSIAVTVVADLDGDGVANAVDACPNTAASVAVTGLGCSEAQLGLTRPPQCTGNYTKLLVGTPLSNVLTAVGGANTVVYGLGGNDVIVGGVGDDCLVGGDGHDVVIDSLGTNVLLGGSGVDNVVGGIGNDTCQGEFKTNCENIVP